MSEIESMREHLESGRPRKAARERLPPWLKKRLPPGDTTRPVREVLAGLRLVTVCEEARCPNLNECWSAGTATFMIMGEICTRSCGFCAVDGPRRPEPLDPDEPERVARAASAMELRHVVITSVDRDDLADGGSHHFAKVVESVRAALPRARLEVLTPDFRGVEEDILRVLDAGPDIYNHNVETVPRLYDGVRRQARYEWSLGLLDLVKRTGHDAFTKSGLMVGLGETKEELYEVFRDLRGVGCDILTVGQYLKPSDRHVPVERFVPPEEFDEYREVAKEMGFRAVASGPFVRSSYHAAEVFDPVVGRSG
ncbi:MAG: lipoyl synthase [Planctomycetota bacterium]|jgi:lipoic acid synthetase